MANSVKVFIGGKEFSLAGDNPEMIKATASMVNKQIENLVSQSGDLPDKSVSYMLAALNIAESDINKTNHILSSTDYLISELNKMESQLKNVITKDINVSNISNLSNASNVSNISNITLNNSSAV